MTNHRVWIAARDRIVRDIYWFKSLMPCAAKYQDIYLDLKNMLSDLYSWRPGEDFDIGEFLVRINVLEHRLREVEALCRDS